MANFIRPTIASDLPLLVDIARGTNVFKPVEIVTLDEVLTDFLDSPGGEGYHCFTYDDGEVQGFSCHGPNSMTDRTWDLYWIAVRKDLHARGVGTKLLHFLEDDIRRQNGRLIMIDTSSLPTYEPTRRFYKKHGYEQVATIADYYADGDSLVLFRKRL